VCSTPAASVNSSRSRPPLETRATPASASNSPPISVPSVAPALQGSPLREQVNSELPRLVVLKASANAPATPLERRDPGLRLRPGTGGLKLPPKPGRAMGAALAAVERPRRTVARENPWPGVA